MNAAQHINPEKLLSVLFYSPNATAVYQGENLKILTANKAMLDFWGKDRSVVGKNFIDALPELINQPFIDILKEVWNSGKTFTAKDTSAILKVDGVLQEFFFDFEYKAILDNEGKTEYILHTAFEVSERIAAWKVVDEKSRAEQELTEELRAINEEYQATNEDLLSKNENLLILEANLQNAIDVLHEKEQRFRRMIEHSPVAMASLKGKSFIVDALNDKMLDIWGKAKSVLGLPLRDALPELETQSFLGVLDEVYETHVPFKGKEIKVMISVNKVLTERYLNFVYHPVFELGSQEKLILIVANDVTEEVLARKEVTDINSRLEVALEAGYLGYGEIDLTTSKMIMTDQFKLNHGFKLEEEISYAKFLNTILPDYREKFQQIIKNSIINNDIYKTEYLITLKDGNLRWLEVHGKPRYDNDGNANRVVAMVSDITERKLFDQRREDFLSVASHELKTPITILKASLQYLDRIKDRPFGDKHAQMIEQSLKYVDRMTDMVNDLLNVKRLSEGQLQIEKRWFNLSEMLQETCNHIRVDGKYNLKIGGDESINVFADENRIDQVVINFVNNAVKYAPSSTNIYIYFEKIEEDIKVSVTDYGDGIQENLLPNLFGRYYRASHSGKDYSGLGLGLYICAEIIKAHKGQIGVDSKVGEGSTFWFIIPLEKLDS